MNSSIKKPLAKGLITAADNHYFKAKLKQVVAQMACYGLIQLAINDWFISTGGSGDE
jgi:hypothetical protein